MLFNVLEGKSFGLIGCSRTLLFSLLFIRMVIPSFPAAIHGGTFAAKHHHDKKQKNTMATIMTGNPHQDLHPKPAQGNMNSTSFLTE
jgi:hypothetical protein